MIDLDKELEKMDPVWCTIGVLLVLIVGLFIYNLHVIGVI